MQRRAIPHKLLEIAEQMLQSWQHSIQYGSIWCCSNIAQTMCFMSWCLSTAPRPKVPKPFDQATRLDAATAGWSASAAGASFEALKWTCWSAPGAVSETLPVIFGLTYSRLAFELIGPLPRLQWSLNFGRAIHFRSTFLAFQWGSEAAEQCQVVQLRTETFVRCFTTTQGRWLSICL